MQIQTGYDPITLNHWLWYKYRCHEGSPTDFQKLFEDIIKRAKPEFMQIRPYGKIGDRKCDGLLKAEGTVFQVYSPDELTQAKLQQKIDEDLDGAVALWVADLKKWVFVYNVRRGLAPDIPGYLSKKQAQYRYVEIDHLSADALWELARRLPVQQRSEVLGAPNGYEHLFLAGLGSEGSAQETLSRSWFVVVHDVMTPINLQSVVKAMDPEAPFGAPVWVRPIAGELPWDSAAAYQRAVVQDAIAKSREILPRFAIFSLSPIPLCIHLGFVLSDRLEVQLFQYHRDLQSWRWPGDQTGADKEFRVQGLPRKAVKGTCEALIRVSLSATVKSEQAIEACGDLPVQIHISVRSPDVMWLHRPEQLVALGRTFRQALSSIRNRVPDCSRLHLFYAGPTGGAITIGQQINPRMNPPVELYEFSAQRTPQYQRAMTLQQG
jgi:hypothetical protein